MHQRCSIYEQQKDFRRSNVKSFKGMRRREFVEFRTPQHPSLGTNNWGGASPLLARDIPKESLEQRYAKLNTIRTRDEIFPAAEEYEFNYWSQDHASGSQREPAAQTPGRRMRGFLSKILRLPWKEKAAATDSNSKKKRWFPRWDHRNRWPQGWC